MTTGAEGGAFPQAAADDPFVVLVDWLVHWAGSKEELARRSKGAVSVRALDYWLEGNYPRRKVTGTVRALDRWAMENVPGYPVDAGVPRLVETCGPRGATAASATVASATVASATVEPPPPADPAPPAAGRRWLRWAVPVAAVLVVALAVVLTVLLTRDPAPEPLPTSASGPSLPETTGSLGANTFADPVRLIDQALRIPPDTTVQVRCRFYAPSIPSVTPDGYWYLIDSDTWAGRWSPANSFMNGDVPGQPTLHNTDFAVPECR